MITPAQNEYRLLSQSLSGRRVSEVYFRSLSGDNDGLTRRFHGGVVEILIRDGLPAIESLSTLLHETLHIRDHYEFIAETNEYDLPSEKTYRQEAQEKAHGDLPPGINADLVVSQYLQMRTQQEAEAESFARIVLCLAVLECGANHDTLVYWMLDHIAGLNRSASRDAICKYLTIRPYVFEDAKKAVEAGGDA